MPLLQETTVTASFIPVKQTSKVQNSTAKTIVELESYSSKVSLTLCHWSKLKKSENKAKKIDH